MSRDADMPRSAAITDESGPVASPGRPGPFSADLVPGVLFTVALLFLAVRLGVPDRYVFDEVYHAYTAGQYAAGNADAYLWDTSAPREGVAYMWNHPPMGVLMMTG